MQREDMWAGDTEKMDMYKLRTEVSDGTNSANILTLNCEKTNFCYLSHQVCGALSW